MGTRTKIKNSGIFITGTDTDVGKTVTSCTLGLLLQKRGIDVGFMKPIQCAGNDTSLVKRTLQLKDSLKEMNPLFVKLLVPIFVIIPLFAPSFPVIVIVPELMKIPSSQLSSRPLVVPIPPVSVIPIPPWISSH